MVVLEWLLKGLEWLMTYALAAVQWLLILGVAAAVLVWLLSPVFRFLKALLSPLWILAVFLWRRFVRGDVYRWKLEGPSQTVAAGLLMINNQVNQMRVKYAGKALRFSLSMTRPDLRNWETTVPGTEALIGYEALVRHWVELAKKTEPLPLRVTVTVEVMPAFMGKPSDLVPPPPSTTPVALPNEELTSSGRRRFYPPSETGSCSQEFPSL